VEELPLTPGRWKKSTESEYITQSLQWTNAAVTDKLTVIEKKC